MISTTLPISDLIGAWSCTALLLGVMGVAACHFFADAQTSERRAAGMLLVAVVIELIVIPSSSAYSGPVQNVVRLLWAYEKTFAAIIATGFAGGFALDALRLRRKARLTTPDP